MCNYAVKKSTFVIRYIPNQYKTKKMCNQAILKNGGALESVLDQCKTQCVIKLLIIMFQICSWSI